MITTLFGEDASNMEPARFAELLNVYVVSPEDEKAPLRDFISYTLDHVVVPGKPHLRAYYIGNKWSACQTTNSCRDKAVEVTDTSSVTPETDTPANPKQEEPMTETIKLDVSTLSLNQGVQIRVRDRDGSDLGIMVRDAAFSRAMTEAQRALKQAGYELKSEPLWTNGFMEIEAVRNTEDPVLDKKFAGVRLRDMATSTHLAEALNNFGWRFVPFAHTDDAVTTWRIQTGYDGDGDYLVVIHNGTSWVSAYRDDSPDASWYELGGAPHSFLTSKPPGVEYFEELARKNTEGS